jgi:hypothetical protein
MTRTSTLLGLNYDAPPVLPVGLNQHESKRAIALMGLRQAEETGDVEATRLCNWELALCDLFVGQVDGVSPYRGVDYVSFGAYHGLTSETVPYAAERAAETSDVILELHYLSYVLLQSVPRGHPWIKQQQRLLGAFRRYIEGTLKAAPMPDGEDFRGLYIEQALRACTPVLKRPGVLQHPEGTNWAAYLVDLAEVSRDFPADSRGERPHMRYRWVFVYVEILCALPPTAVDQPLRDRALRLLDEAAAHYTKTPLEDHFSCAVADVDAKVRKHWGETGTHERKIRSAYSSLLRRAEFHEASGNGLLTAHFYAEARRLVEQHRQYFGEPDVVKLQRATQAALNHAVEAGELSEIRIPMEIPVELLDHVRETPEETIAALVRLAASSVPNFPTIGERIEEFSADTPLHARLARTVIGSGKIVGESTSAESNKKLDVEEASIRQSQILGMAFIHTALKGATRVGLAAEHLVVPLESLGLDEGTREILLHGCRRLLAEDWISAAHVLVLRVEDVFRQQLRNLGVDTTDYRGDVGDGTARTDDASLGALMRQTLPDGRTVKEYLGSDLWQHMDVTLNSQTGLNLRNVFAHGLARPEHCASHVVGLTFALLYQLVSIGPNASSTVANGIPRAIAPQETGAHELPSNRGSLPIPIDRRGASMRQVLHDSKE